MAVVWIASTFLIIAGLVFLIGALAPRGLALTARLRDRLELSGAFETAAAIISGLLFLVSGGAVMVSLDRYA